MFGRTYERYFNTFLLFSHHPVTLHVLIYIYMIKHITCDFFNIYFITHFHIVNYSSARTNDTVLGNIYQLCGHLQAFLFTVYSYTILNDAKSNTTLIETVLL